MTNTVTSVEQLRVYHWAEVPESSNSLRCDGHTEGGVQGVGRSVRVIVWRLVDKEKDRSEGEADIVVRGCNYLCGYRCQITSQLCILDGVLSADNFLATIEDLKRRTKEKAVQASR